MNLRGVGIAFAISIVLVAVPHHPLVAESGSLSSAIPGSHEVPASNAVGNFSSALQRLVDLVGFSGSALLAIVWARVALSWFSNDVA